MGHHHGMSRHHGHHDEGHHGHHGNGHHGHHGLHGMRHRRRHHSRHHNRHRNEYSRYFGMRGMDQGHHCYHDYDYRPIPPPPYDRDFLPDENEDPIISDSSSRRRQRRRRNMNFRRGKKRSRYLRIICLILLMFS